LAAQTAVKN